MKLRAVLTVTVDTEGDYYADHDDMVRHVIPWIEGTLEDRDDIRNVAITEAAIRTAAGQDQPATEGAPLVLPLAQVRFLHETLGRLLPDDGRPAGQDQPHERRERYAAAIQLKVVPRIALTSILPEVYEATDAAMAVADTEQQDLRVRAEQLADLLRVAEQTSNTAERRAVALDRALGSTAADAAAHRFCAMRENTVIQRAEGAEAERDRLRAELAQARSAALTEAADALDESETLRDLTDDHMGDVHMVTNELRRMANEAQQAGHPQPATEEQPA